MRPASRWVLTLGLVTGWLLGLGPAWAASIVPIPEVKALGAEGRVAASSSVQRPGVDASTRPAWVSAAAVIPLPSWDGYVIASLGVANEGSVIMGLFEGVAPVTLEKGVVLYRWTAEVGAVLIEPGEGLGGFLRSLRVSRDGGTAVGQVRAGGCCPEPEGVAYRWTEATGYIRQPELADVSAVSANGRILVGPLPGRAEALGRLDLDRGWQEIAPGAGNDPGPVRATEALMSPDGTRVVCPDAGAPSRLRVWTSGTGRWETLAPMPVGFGTTLAGMTDDGAVVVGRNAWVWQPGRDPRSLAAYFTERGVDLTGWTLLTCEGVSADGMVFVGTAEGIDDGTSAAKPKRGWMVLLDDRHLAPPDPVPARRYPAMAIGVPTRAGNRYQLESATGLGNWAKEGAAFEGDGATNTLSRIADGGQRLYRVVETN